MPINIQVRDTIQKHARDQYVGLIRIIGADRVKRDFQRCAIFGVDRLDRPQGMWTSSLFPDSLIIDPMRPFSKSYC